MGSAFSRARSGLRRSRHGAGAYVAHSRLTGLCRPLHRLWAELYRSARQGGGGGGGEEGGDPLAAHSTLI